MCAAIFIGNCFQRAWDKIITIIQRVSYLNDAEGGRCYRVREVTTRGGDGSHQGDGALTFGVAETLRSASALIKAGESSAQVSWVARVSGHLSETT